MQTFYFSTGWENVLNVPFSCLFDSDVIFLSGSTNETDAGFVMKRFHTKRDYLSLLRCFFWDQQDMLKNSCTQIIFTLKIKETRTVSSWDFVRNFRIRPTLPWAQEIFAARLRINIAVKLLGRFSAPRNEIFRLVFFIKNFKSITLLHVKKPSFRLPPSLIEISLSNSFSVSGSPISKSSLYFEIVIIINYQLDLIDHIMIDLSFLMLTSSSYETLFFGTGLAATDSNRVEMTSTESARTFSNNNVCSRDIFLSSGKCGMSFPKL